MVKAFNDDRKSFSVIPEKVETVRRCFQLRLEGKSIWEIVRILNDEGHRSLNQYKAGKFESNLSARPF